MGKKIRLVLASASPRRRQLLRKLKIPFVVMPSHVSESSRERNPIRLVRDLALRKAAEIARRLSGRRSDKRRSRKRRSSERRFVVLGADTVVVLHRRILGKPRDARDASRMLGELSGTTHAVYTGVALVETETKRTVVAHAKSEVRMKKIAQDALQKLSRRHLDKAGSYAIQEKRDPIARVVKGSYDNVVGLPVTLVKALLKKLSRAV